ncbi:MAG: MmgE/PrpD family protein [Betaproteobacteria bacterium]
MKPEPIEYLERLSTFGAELDFLRLPAEVREQASWILADTIAAVVAGAAEPEMRALSARLCAQARGSAVLPGRGLATAPLTAALLNGTAGTFLEMDEGNRYSRGHPAIHVIPAALALAQSRGRDTRHFMSALVSGYEIGSRLGAAAQLRGSMHPHGTWGTIGAAAACARLVGHDAAAFREVLNISASLTVATSKRTMLEGGLVRNTYAGLSNHNGVLALTLGECGFSGERDGPGSLLGSVVSERFDREIAIRGLGTEWHVMQNYFKLHSCCRYNHGALDALDRIAQHAPLPAAEDIASIEVRSYHLAAELNDPDPRNTLAAKFSVPFALATRIIHGHSHLAAFTWEAVRDERVLALAHRVRISEDRSMSARLPAERPAHVALHLRDGRILEAEVGVNRGDDASPYSPGELSMKFMDLCGRVWPASHCERLLEATLGLGRGSSSLDDWLPLLAAPNRNGDAA